MASPIIDVEAEDLRRNYIKELFKRNHVYIPERFYVQLKKLNLLDCLVEMIEEQNEIKPVVSNILQRHNICIPEKFFQPMINKKLFWRVIRALRLADIKNDSEQLDQLPIDRSDDEKDSDIVSKKRKPSARSDVDSISKKISRSSDDD